MEFINVNVDTHTFVQDNLELGLKLAKIRERVAALRKQRRYALVFSAWVPIHMISDTYWKKLSTLMKANLNQNQNPT